MTNFRKSENFYIKKNWDPKEIGKFVKFIVRMRLNITGSTVYFDGNINKSFI